ncbi:MAG TPA: TIGR04076 family protein [Candidatus Marinimicrobia bacterium]|jgi:uncharacterized repeat protein (TIGR04076 family)|nr:TIGR04076 family protein [Candidatus Neomarinimicrobiota bacterium]HJL84981.1 TIGR04076 family protein [Candidatus Neomarinimicrobiota bacterium]
MYELKVTVKKVMGECTAEPAMKSGDYFTVSDGDIQIPEGGYICLWALQSLMPLITPKEREITEEQDEDWMWRVHHAQCPDPKGRVIFKIERTGNVDRNDREEAEHQAPKTINSIPSEEEGLKTLRIEVESFKGHCTSRMEPGDSFQLRSGRLYIPEGCHFCLYALQAALPLLPAKQRALEDGDWMKEDSHVLCPDPTGNVVLRIEEMKDIKEEKKHSGMKEAPTS